MAFSPQNGSAHDEPLASINVTPFVDVVLVLLIIFMITAGVFDFGIEVDVPETREVVTTQQQFPFVNVTGDAKVYFNTVPVEVAEIPAMVLADYASRAELAGQSPGIFLRAHRTAPWEAIAPIVEVCGNRDITVSMVTKPLEQQQNPR